MATCEEIKNAAKVVCPSLAHPGWLDLSPPVRFSSNGSGRRSPQLAYLLNKETSQVWLVGEQEPRPVEMFRVSELQGRILVTEITKELLDELEELLNKVADQRVEDDVPTSNASAARNLLDEFGMECCKGL